MISDSSIVRACNTMAPLFMHGTCWSGVMTIEKMLECWPRGKLDIKKEILFCLNSLLILIVLLRSMVELRATERYI